MNKRNNHSVRFDDALTEVMRRRAAAEPQLPADFSQRVTDAMMARRRKARLRTIVGWSTLGAVAATLLLAFFLLHKPVSPADKQMAEMPTKMPTAPAPSDTTVFEPLYKQTAQFIVDSNQNSTLRERNVERSIINGYPLLPPYREGLYSKLAPGVYIEIEEGTGDTVYVVITNQSVPAPATRPVLPEVNIAERMQQAEEFGKQLRKEFDSIHFALNK